MQNEKSKVFKISIFHTLEDGSFELCYQEDGDEGLHGTGICAGYSIEEAQQFAQQKNNDLKMNHK